MLSQLQAADRVPTEEAPALEEPGLLTVFSGALGGGPEFKLRRTSATSLQKASSKISTPEPADGTRSSIS
jgi:hypothetical protein